MAAEPRLESRAMEDLREMPMVEIAYEILRSANETFYYRDLMQKVAALRGMSEDDIQDSIARLYTDINIDGRFVCVGENVWGLRRWYPVERTMERGAGKRFVRRDEGDLDDEDVLDDVIDLEDDAVVEDDTPFVEEEEQPFEDELAAEEDEDGEFTEEDAVEEEEVFEEEEDGDEF